ncbi:uncharacterized protein FOMMEDRAFT_140591 [Fomitiporia mediterranea MF3/22]|uniref:uncharacterized protein n=1 Tax=Fomitiporia mediterranea (strain MF3/22) TaxID=694068 RepID=UPI00044072EF|nr:uncharacterized protein FOMMEDRAFT_140591 [Fomitiporia mediterranea MF3/22]EJD02688.1 hypothetical protein FOMMEDRAFT_140591 [Fomitiporia mediterranea MF3/22]
MLAVSLQRKHYIRIGAFLLVLILFWHRISVGFTLAYTYFAFTFLPTAVLGNGDGWDLENLIPPPDAPELVPRIIHQARLGDLEMKDTWREANQSCASLNPAPEWRFELWDTPRANAFVEENYPELLDMYLGYGQEIQRSNVIRYLILYKMGGIYLDLDIKCKVPLDFFTTVDWVSPPGVPTGINNAFMAAAPGHPFLKHAIDNLQRFDLNWISLYATDMFSAGCHYISTMHATYAKHSTLRVLPREYKLGGVSSTPIFDHLGAASWHRGDASAIKALGVVVQWLLVPWKIITITVASVVGSVWLCRRRARRAEKIRAEDVELFDVEHELLRGGAHPETERRALLVHVWRDSMSDEEATFRSASPGSQSSRISSSESTLQADEDNEYERDGLKDHKFS